MPDTTLYIRVKQALTWLKRNGILQKDIADKMGMAESSFTRALARIKEKNDEDFVISFHSTVSKFISLDYLLNGRGEMLVQKEKADDAHTDTPTVLSSSMDTSFLIEKAVEKATAYADKTIATLESQIADKDKYIKVLEKRIAELEAQQQDAKDILRKHPFPIGVADKDKTEPKRV